MPTIYTAKSLTAALAAAGWPLHYSTVLQDILPLLLAVGMAQKPSHDYAITEDGLAALLTYLRGRVWLGFPSNTPHSPWTWRVVFNLLPTPRPWEPGGVPVWLQAEMEKQAQAQAQGED